MAIRLYMIAFKDNLEDPHTRFQLLLHHIEIFNPLNFQVVVNRDIAPKFSFGVRHSEYMAMMPACRE